MKEVIGAEPEIENFRTTLQNQFDTLLNNLETNNSTHLQELLEFHILSEKEVNGRPGAMALPQNKIKLFTEFNQKLIQAINKKLDS